MLPAELGKCMELNWVTDEHSITVHSKGVCIATISKQLFTLLIHGTGTVYCDDLRDAVSHLIRLCHRGCPANYREDYVNFQMDNLIRETNQKKERPQNEPENIPTRN